MAGPRVRASRGPRTGSCAGHERRLSEEIFRCRVRLILVVGGRDNPGHKRLKSAGRLLRQLDQPRQQWEKNGIL